MKRALILAVALVILSCNSGKNESQKTEKTSSDSLLKEVMDYHDAGMSRYGKMLGLRKKLDAALDSISKLPGKAREEAAPYEQKLKEAGQELNTAIAEMDKWMETFNTDSALDDMKARLRYLTDEKLKVGKIKDLIFNSVAKADSILTK